MNKAGPILVVDDDADDPKVIADAFRQIACPNEIVVFPDASSALAYLNTEGVHPFFILSDVNMPVMDGFELRQRVLSNEGLKLKCIPYLLLTTSPDKDSINQAFDMSMNGYFVKPLAYKELIQTLRAIIEYWQVCYSPLDDALLMNNDL